MIEYKYYDTVKVVKGFYEGHIVLLLKKIDNKYMACLYHGNYKSDDIIIVDETELGKKVDIYA
jgi:hypothetical protein